MSALDAFEKLLNAGRGGPPLLETAARLPQYADPAFDPAAVVDTVRQWGRRLGARIPADLSAANRLRMLNHFFFDELGFRGARADYDSPDNSYLHRVIERRRGIPITLSLLYVEIGRAAGLRLFGVGFPGHFLVKLPVGDASIYIDVYGGGTSLSLQDLQARLDALGRGRGCPLADCLRAAGDRDILARMLRNLKRIHAQSEDWNALLEVQHRLVALLPQAAGERRDRAAVYARLQCPRGAADDLSAYLAMQPDPPDALEIRTRLAELRDEARRLN